MNEDFEDHDDDGQDVDIDNATQRVGRSRLTVSRMNLELLSRLMFMFELFG